MVKGPGYPPVCQVAPPFTPLQNSVCVYTCVYSLTVSQAVMLLSHNHTFKDTHCAVMLFMP